MTRNDRKSNLELLRILAMLAIVVGHCSFAYLGDRSFALELMSRFSRIAVNIFLIVGCWFMVDHPPVSKKVVRLYLATGLTTVFLTVVALAVGADVSIKDVVRGFMPFLGRPLWFVSAYLWLMLASPHLHAVIKGANRVQQNFILLSVVTVSVICTLPDVQDAYVLDVFWFFCIYLVIGVAKSRWNVADIVHRWRLPILLGSAVVYVAMVWMAKYVPAARPFFYQYFFDIKSLPNIICAIGIFAAFLSFDFGSKSAVNSVASGALGVYMLHETPAFRGYLWNEIFAIPTYASFIEARILVVAVVVYLCGLLYWSICSRVVNIVMGHIRMLRLFMQATGNVMKKV